MSKQKDVVKGLVKKNEPAKATFGTDPNDPWSAKNNMAETSIIGTRSGVLQKFLKSRGIDPRYVSKAQRIGHAKTGEFNKWKRDHMAEDKDPCWVGYKQLGMKDKNGKKVPNCVPAKEEVEKIDELSKDTLNSYMWSAKTDRDNTDIKASKAIEKNRKDFSTKRHAKITKLLDKSLKRTGNIIKATNKIMAKEEVDKKDAVTFDIPLLIRVLELAREDIKSDMDLHRVVERLINMRNKGMLTMDDYDEIAAIKEEVAHSIQTDYIKEALTQLNTEAKEANYGGGYQDSVKALKAKAEKKPVDMKSLAARMQASYAKDKKQDVKEASCDCVKEMSKSARMIKALYKHHKVVKEELYDGEKEDKSVATYGKKPKFDKTDEKKVKDEVGAAAAVMSGGKALTGAPRDTVEIDPMMKVRPGSPDPMKAGQKFNNTRND